MTIKRLIAGKAYELAQLIEHCNDFEFIVKTIAAVMICDYAALNDLEDMDDGHNQP